MKRIKLKDHTLPKYTKGEEIFNTVSHIVGGIVGIVALVLCVVFSILNKNGYALAGSIVFGITMISLYVISSIYHGLNPNTKPTAKKVFRIIDHCTIFFLIAGTYTPVLLCSVREVDVTLAWILFGVIWLFAILGTVLNAIDIKKYKVFSMICYLGMGWCIVITAPYFNEMFSLKAISLLAAGGIAYTVGAFLYMAGAKLKYFHSIFHIFVVIGSLLHFLGILLYII